MNRRTAKQPRPANRYPHAHQQLRARLAPTVAAGHATCAHCGKPIAPGEPWDLGHDDHDRTRYAGPEHRACNRSTANRDTRRWQVNLAAPLRRD